MKEQVRLDGRLFSSDAQVLRVVNWSGQGTTIDPVEESSGKLKVRVGYPQEC
jgi:hypothetical protein